MNFSRRLRLYLIGFALGIGLVYAFFNGRLGNWLPEEQVQEQLQRNPLLIDDLKRCFMDCYGITEGDVNRLLQQGDVDFGKSKPRQEPHPIYHMESKLPNGNDYYIAFELQDSTATRVKEVWSSKEGDCDCR